MFGLFNQALLGKWLWRFGEEVNHLWRQVIATKYGEVSGGWCTRTRVVRGTHGCVLWKNIRKGVDSFLGHVVYAAGEGVRIRFWHNPWSSPISLKELYPESFVCAVVQEALISDMILHAPDGRGRNWNLLFHHEFNGWEMGRFYPLSMFLPEFHGGRVMIL